MNRLAPSTKSTKRRRSERPTVPVAPDTFQKHYKYSIHGNLVSSINFNVPSWAHTFTVVWDQPGRKVCSEQMTLLVDDDPGEAPVTGFQLRDDEITGGNGFYEFATVREALCLYGGWVMKDKDDAPAADLDEFLCALRVRGFTEEGEWETLLSRLEAEGVEIRRAWTAENEQTFCENNDCEAASCHRCFPRTGCADHERCKDATARGEAYTAAPLT